LKLKIIIKNNKTPNLLWFSLKKLGLFVPKNILAFLSNS